MVIEGTVITVVFSVSTVIGSAFVMKYMLGECKRKQVIVFERLEKHGDDLVKLNTKSIDAKYVEDKFVSKELFRQFEKHIDGRFDDIVKGQDEILGFMRHIELLVAKNGGINDTKRQR